MPNISPAQDHGREKVGKWGTQYMGCPTTRPDGTLIKVCMLDPRDPGTAVHQQERRIFVNAERGSRRLLAAIARFHPEHMRTSA